MILLVWRYVISGIVNVTTIFVKDAAEVEYIGELGEYVFVISSPLESNEIVSFKRGYILPLPLLNLILTIPVKVAEVVILTRGFPFVIRVPVLVAVSEIWLDSTVKIEKNEFANG